jgi:nucleoside phosphorylase
MEQRVDIVIVTVNDHEKRELIKAFGAAGKQRTIQGRSRQSYLDLGIVNNQRVVCAPSLMASFDSGASFDTVLDALNDFSPSVVLAVGIAWGSDEEKQHIGDILLSQSLYRADHRKVKEGEVILRGSKTEAEGLLVKHFKNIASMMMPSIEIHSGTLLSIETLFDSKPERDAFIKAYPEAVGGEMEGGGLYKALYHHEKNLIGTSSSRTKTNWLIVKAICDWGYKKGGADKEANQALAAKNAAQLTFETIHQLDIRPVSDREEDNPAIALQLSKVRDEKDRKTLVRLFEQIHLKTLDNYFHWGKQSTLYHRTEHYYFGFKEVMVATGFNLFDPKIKACVEEFVRWWEISLYEYASYFRDTPNEDLKKFDSRHDIYQDKAAKAAHDGFAEAIYKTEETLKQLCTEVQTKYPDFDLEATSAAAYRDYLNLYSSGQD